MFGKSCGKEGSECSVKIEEKSRGQIAEGGKLAAPLKSMEIVICMPENLALTYHDYFQMSPSLKHIDIKQLCCLLTNSSLFKGSLNRESSWRPSAL